MISSIVRIGVICIGIILIFASVRLNAARRMLVNHAAAWSIVGVVAILVGSTPLLSSWSKLLAPGTVVTLFAAGVLFLFTEFRTSVAISQLTIKNRELAMQVALLNCECDVPMVPADVERPTNEALGGGHLANHRVNTDHGGSFSCCDCIGQRCDRSKTYRL